MPSEDRQETMTTMLPFGRECIPVTLPIENVAAVAAPDGFPALEDPEREVFSSLSHPVGSPEISRIMGPGARVLIICDDNTRATPAEIMVGALLKELGDNRVHTPL